LEHYLHLGVGGIDNALDEFVDWTTPDIKVGDEIRIQVVEVTQADAPNTCRPRQEVCRGITHRKQSRVQEKTGRIGRRRRK
ncbi:MAG: hypothetical protein K0Q72_3160, partial [Armatimonadetes bacterium]|nr:hypothetical protein [Armatimonadota bacterium]